MKLLLLMPEASEEPVFDEVEVLIFLLMPPVFMLRTSGIWPGALLNTWYSDEAEDTAIVWLVLNEPPYE